MKNSDNTILGYTSLNDFFTTFFGLKTILLNSFFAFIAWLTAFINHYVWDSSDAVYALFSLMLFDWVLGVSLAIRATFVLSKFREKLTPEKIIEYEKRRFSSSKFPRIFVTIPVAFWLLSVAWNLSKAHTIFIPLPSIVYGGFAGAYVVSLWENLTEMGFFSKEVLILVKEKLDITKYFKK